jgi:hypothetical protein
LSILAAPKIGNNAAAPVGIVGTTLLSISGFVCGGGIFCMIRSRRYRVKKVLANESMKYSRKLMLPFTWRLEIHKIPSDVDGDPDKTIENVSNII